MGRVHRSFITHDELSKSLGKRIYLNNLSQAFLYILDEKIGLVEKV